MHQGVATIENGERRKRVQARVEGDNGRGGSPKHSLHGVIQPRAAGLKALTGLSQPLTGIVAQNCCGKVGDLTLMLEVPRDVALTRLRARGGADDRYERLDEAFHRRVNDGFREISRQPRHVPIDAAGAADSVHAAIMAAVGRMF